MTKALIPFVTDHITRHAAQIVRGRKMCLALNGHQSQKFHDWLFKSKEINLEVFHGLAHTSHFLEVCIQSTSRSFKTFVHKTFEYISTQFHIDYDDLRTKLKLGVAGYGIFSKAVVQKEFHSCGLWPMNFRLLKWAEQKWSGQQPQVVERKLSSKRLADTCDLDDVMSIVSLPLSKQNRLQAIRQIFEQGHQRTKNIIERRTPTKKSFWRYPIGHFDRTTISRGAPPAYLIYGELIKCREEEEKETIEQKKIKEREKQDIAVRKQKKNQEDAE